MKHFHCRNHMSIIILIHNGKDRSKLPCRLCCRGANYLAIEMKFCVLLSFIFELSCWRLAMDKLAYNHPLVKTEHFGGHWASSCSGKRPKNVWFGLPLVVVMSICIRLWRWWVVMQSNCGKMKHFHCCNQMNIIILIHNGKDRSKLSCPLCCRGANFPLFFELLKSCCYMPCPKLLKKVPSRLPRMDVEVESLSWCLVWLDWVQNCWAGTITRSVLRECLVARTKKFCETMVMRLSLCKSHSTLWA
jgi:hypothetical protein